MSKTVVAVYDDYNAAQSAVRDLVNQGFRRDDISLVSGNARGEHRDYLSGEPATRAAEGGGMGAVLGGLAGLLVGLGALTIPGVGPMLAAGPVAATLAGAGVGAIAGGLVGALADAGVPQREASIYAEAIRRGATLVTVRLPDNDAGTARTILNEHGAADINQRAQDWRREGWRESGEPAAEPEQAQTHGTDAPYATSPLEIDEQVGPVRRDSAYGGAEAENVERAGTEYTHDQSLSVERPAAGAFNTPESPQQGGFSSGAGQSGAGYQGGPGDENTPSPAPAPSGDDFRRHYDAVYGNSGQDYEHYRPAYVYGQQMAANERFRNRKWSEVEPEIRQQWQQSEPPASWDDYREAVRYGWEHSIGAEAASDQDPGTAWSGTAGSRLDRPSFQGPEERRI